MPRTSIQQPVSLYRRARRLAIVIVCVCVASLAGEVMRRYSAAGAKLDAINFKERGDLSGAIFAAAPKKIFVGQELSRRELEDYLRSINYTQNDFALEGSGKLCLTARLAEFQSAVITFNQNRVRAIEILDANNSRSKVKEIEIEPPTLATYVWAVDENGKADEDIPFVEAISPRNPARMIVRRYVMNATDIMGTKLFFSVLAAEDNQFMNHRGVRFVHLVQAPFQGRGGSTITSQVIKNAVSLDASHSFRRKLDELFLTAALESKFSKAEIFELYSNHVYLGVSADGFSLYGFAAASEEFFGVRDVKLLTLGQAVTLAALIKKPNRLLGISKQNPRPTRETIDYKMLQGRREYVLGQLAEEFPDKFTAQELEAARREPVAFVFKSRRESNGLESASRSFVEYAASTPVLNSVSSLTEHSGLHVYTSVDADLMLAAQAALEKRLPEIRKSFPPVDLETGAAVDDRLLGTIVALDPRDGQIIALIGGALKADGKIEPSRQAVNADNRCPASVLKVFWACRAISDGKLLNDGKPYTAESIINPADGRLNGWQPDFGVGVPCRVGQCLARSDDGWATFTLSHIGLPQGAEFFRELFGVKPPLQGKLAIGLSEGAGVSPMKMARALSLFVNGGSVVEPVPLAKVFQNGLPVPLPPAQKSKPLVKPQAAAATIQMMRSVLGWGADGGFGTARKLPFARKAIANNLQIGAKTGSGPSDLWMISVSPRLVVVVWVGYENGHSKFEHSGDAFAAQTAAMVWDDFLTAVLKSRPDFLIGKF